MLKRVSCFLLVFILLIVGIPFATSGEDSEIIEPPVPSARFTNIKRVSADPVGAAKGADLTESDHIVAQNSRFELYLDEQALIVKVRDKSNNYVWSSAVPKNKMQSLNFEWQRIASSLLTAEYLNPAGSVSRSPLKHSSAKAPEITKIESGFQAMVEFYEAGIELTVKVELTEKGIKVSVPDESIVQKKENILHKLYIMPFFGASLADEIPGYVFIPDGCGALIRYSKPRTYISSFSERVYGPDYAMKRPATGGMSILQADKKMIHMPVFGAAHGGRQNAFLAVATSGDAFMEIEASPAGVITDFTWVGAKFIYRDLYTQPTSKSGGAFTALQPTSNTVNAAIEYIFLSGEDADYVGMAKAYREMLKEKGMLGSKAEEGTPVRLKIEAIMSEPTKGLITNRNEIMTRIADVRRWIDELGANGVEDLSVVLWGFEKGGVNGHKLNSFRLDPAIGSKKEMEELYNKLVSGNSELMLRQEVQSGYEDQIDKSRLAYHIDGGILEKFEVTKPLFNHVYYLNIHAVRKAVEGYGKKPQYMRNIALSGVSTNLFSDYKRGREIHRNEMVEEIRSVLEAAQENTGKLALYEPNAYAFGYADAVYDIPMQTSQFVFETDTVPFMQIVLSGSIDYYAPNLNFGTNTVEDVLKLIDYGAYPSYVLTEQYSNKLASTNLNDIYTSRYEDWKPYIIENYKAINDILSKVRGKAINRRFVPEDGIVLVEYEGGTTILINYTDKSYTYNNQTFGGLSAAIVKEG